MPLSALMDRGLDQLRRHDAVYSALRRSRNWVRDSFVEAVRHMAPARSVRFGPPKGVFSEYELLQQSLVQGGIVYKAQACPPLAPDSLRKLCNLHQDEFQPWPHLWTRRSEVRLVGPSLAHLDHHKRLCLEAMYGKHCLPFDRSYWYLRLPPPVRLSGNWTSIISCWSGGVYHWWMDALTRLARLGEFPADTQILVPANLRPWQLESVRLLGLEGRVRPTSEKHLLVENYFFSSPLAMTGAWNPYGIDWLRERFLSAADKDWTPPRRVFIHRVGKRRGLANEAEVLDFFRKNGWRIIDPETLTVRRQIRLFAEADMLCGLHGGAFINTLWCKPGCRVLEICADNFLNGVYEGIAAHLRLSHRYMVCKGNGLRIITVDVQRLREQVALHFREKQS